jgi:hypothetical protein
MTVLIAQLTAGLALVFAVTAFSVRLRAFYRLKRPKEMASPRGNISQGIMYAYTLGMAPWAKESTRRHWLSYMRGVTFHLGIFLAIALLLVSPWVGLLPAWVRTLLAVVAGFTALLGLIGFIARYIEPSLKALSTPDDYFAVLLVSFLLATTALWLLVPATAALFYFTAALTALYAPFGKIKHCFYYAFSRFFYGRYVGIRSVLPHSQQKVG